MCDKRLGSPPQDNQEEPSVIKHKVGRPTRDPSPWNVITFSCQCFDTVGWVTGRAFSL